MDNLKKLPPNLLKEILEVVDAVCGSRYPSLCLDRELFGELDYDKRTIRLGVADLIKTKQVEVGNTINNRYICRTKKSLLE